MGDKRVFDDLEQPRRPVQMALGAMVMVAVMLAGATYWKARDARPAQDDKALVPQSLIEEPLLPVEVAREVNADLDRRYSDSGRFPPRLRQARQGVAQAQYETGLWYREMGDVKAAYRWVFTAAEQGHIDSAIALSRIYRNGEGRDIDPIRGYAWYLLAVEGGYRGRYAGDIGVLDRKDRAEADRIAAIYRSDFLAGVRAGVNEDR
ncbi:MAG: hypothetical protein RJQ08_12165 [Salinisphaeraceae bacterium]|uniref:Sel1 repeat family protein n=1 Tax=Spectribacter acetivorans TaxID=3075603 RepID=A0ABU3BC08_9GAMM|nr:hypothetical protein [Salinisphaera sp. P385]MDT0618511.1 hypothetical protein [Salinisphaera sp. P385]